MSRRNQIGRVSAAVAAAIAAFGIAIYLAPISAQQGGSGKPGGSNFSTQYRANSTTFGGAGPGTAGQVLTSNGAAAAPTFQSAGGGGCPSGNDGNVQTKNGTSCAGSDNLNWNGTTLNLGGTLTNAAGTVTIADDLSVNPTGGPNGELTVTNTDILFGSGLNIGSAGSVVTFGSPVSTPASSTSSAGLKVVPGAAPTSPVNGDIWTTSAGLFVRINGSTVGPLAAGVSEVTGTGTLTYADGFTTDLTQTYSYSVIGNIASITFTQNVSGTSDSTNFTSDALPAALRPARIQQFLTLVGTGSVADGCVRILTTGVVHLILPTQSVPLQCNVTGNDGWTASGNKAFYPNVGISPSVGLAGPTFVYSLQ